MLSEQSGVGKAGDRPLRINDLQSFGSCTPHYLHILLEGDVQPQIHVQLSSAMIDFQRNVLQAVSASRWCPRLLPSNSNTHIFEGAADWRCNGIALGW